MIGKDDGYRKRLRYIEYVFDSPLGMINNSMFGKATPMIVYLFVFFIPAFIGLNFIAFDIVTVAIYLLYKYIIKELILTGKIKAYYRRSRSFDGIFVFAYNSVVPVSIIRLLIYSTFNIFFRYTSISHALEDTIYSIQPLSKETLIPIALSFLAFYFAYYHDKYTTPEEFTNGILYRERNLDMSRGYAITDFCRDRDAELGMNEYRGNVYDKHKAEEEYNRQQWETERINNDLDKEEIRKEKPERALRRTARKED